MVVCMHYCGTAVLEAHGTLEVRKAIAAGKHLTTLAFSEIGSRSHFWAPVGTAVADGANVKLNARKSWVTSARTADSYVWSSKPVSGGEASTLWYVPRDTAGLRIASAPFDGIGLRGNDSSPITAEDAKLPQAARLGDDGAGFGIMMGTVLPWFNVMSASVSCGLMEAAVQRTAAHAGGPRFQHACSSIAISRRCAPFIAHADRDEIRTRRWVRPIVAMSTGRADAQLRVLESKAADGAGRHDRHRPRDARLRGAAFRKEVGVERIFRDSRAALVMGPTTDVLYDFIGKAVCGLPLF